MDSFYKQLENDLNIIKSNLNDTKRLFQHNHQPVRYIVKDCLYCQIHGNVLASDLNLSDTQHSTQNNITYSIHHKVLN